jgi:hypothetical protein
MLCHEKIDWWMDGFKVDEVEVVYILATNNVHHKN